MIKVIACEIAFREICWAAATAPNIVDLEFLTQGHHDVPVAGRGEIQGRINAVPAGKYDAIVLGYGLCSQILVGLTTIHTPLVVPRAHDCISLFLGSKERYQQSFEARPGTYYYTSGWLECRRRREGQLPADSTAFLPAYAGPGTEAAYRKWVQKYGEEKARYLVESMRRWTQHYTHGVLITYPFTEPLGLDKQVRQICAERGWQYGEIAGDLGLFERALAGKWNDQEFLVVQPGQAITATYDEGIIAATPAPPV